MAMARPTSVMVLIDRPKYLNQRRDENGYRDRGERDHRGASVPRKKNRIATNTDAPISLPCSVGDRRL